LKTWPASSKIRLLARDLKVGALWNGREDFSRT
jgi:hypothetical protein